MARFRTELPVIDFPFGIAHEDGLLCLGSCFAEHIGERLGRYKFRSLLNPFGILYNPVSMVETLDWLAGKTAFPEDLLFEHQGLWHSFAHHGAFSGPDRALTLRRIHERLEEGRRFLAQANRLILTLGTAHVFVYRETGRVVANCHKLPGQVFERHRLEVHEVVDTLAAALQLLYERQPALRVILTVSPVRHIRDGLVENQRSKATLLLAVAELEKRFDWLFYFPAYELLIDDLRDYRFYAADMIHPSETAIDYVWDFFCRTFFSEETQALLGDIQKIIAAARHRPFHPGSEAHQAFLHKQLEKIAALEEQFGFLSFEEERNLFAKAIR